MASHRCWPYLLRFREGVRARPRARVRVRVRVRARVNPGASLGHTPMPSLRAGVNPGASLGHTPMPSPTSPASPMSLDEPFCAHEILVT
jgi:hypothetical protein